MSKRFFSIFWGLMLVLSPAIAQEATDGGADAPREPTSTTTEVVETAAPENTVDTTTATNQDQDAPLDEGAEAEEMPSEASAEADATNTDDDRFVVICPIEGEINEGMAVVVKRAVEEAKNAEALLFVINTPGGRVDSAIEITSAIMTVECPTIAYIEGMGAISAGAIISYSCDYIYMAEGTNIGASTPIMPGVETTEAMDEKSNSFVRGKYRALGEANGHNPLLGEAMVDRNMELRGYRTEEGDYFVFKVDQEEKAANKTQSGDAFDKILDLVSEDGGDSDMTDILRKIVGAAAGAEKTEEPAEGTDDEDDPYAQFINNTDVISEFGELLTLTSNEALHVDLAAGITTDVDDTLREFFLGSVNRMTITPTWEEALFAFLTNPTIAGLLLMAGLGGIYVEVRTPGFGAPGIIGTACLALFFGSHMVIGMTDWVDVVLILIGFILILAEMFLLPGFGLAGIFGFLFLVGGAYMALVKAPIPEFTWEFQQLNDAFYTLTVTIVSLIAFITISGFLLPFTPMGRMLVLSTVVGAPEQYATEPPSAMGLTGVASSVLRPAGKGRFGTAKYDVVTRGEFIDKGTPITIIESSGNRYVVTAIEQENVDEQSV